MEKFAIHFVRTNLPMVAVKNAAQLCIEEKIEQRIIDELITFLESNEDCSLPFSLVTTGREIKIYSKYTSRMIGTIEAISEEIANQICKKELMRDRKMIVQQEPNFFAKIDQEEYKKFKKEQLIKKVTIRSFIFIGVFAFLIFSFHIAEKWVEKCAPAQIEFFDIKS